MKTLPNSTLAPVTVQGGGASTSTRKTIATDLLPAITGVLTMLHSNNHAQAE
ncbi:hypothetical protein EC990815_2954 [Escherichia coli 99.0815]|uniref:Uncharacterized protein n=2 Tax=Escherichia coli TaxID=562 RepID=A0A0H3PQ90_ECO5C|nr:hypothetical protein ECH74115_3478 [Escherichia coli O157:H7 str. EC4115]EDU34977.1 hypothetical protein ECH7EC4196_4621 [Escherichia coli O157:H7 str. EC4196]EDU55430.1 hypothetical protein ECH7EC4113_3882 [Escherichia coli O157:H7 str. EC4113]EDU71173.1 hypothetical protein ECH7EC4076_4778 [Escherichia coli O157:H7 str. EC4076]EDU76107.1 hypothetical protein ECH7EC4401_2155 [Escherichia coli O157:H7 str. EC4401]EDU81242.1 hypothetical protein ECH7EC4486_1405 [Escherichia coli O157:H7 str.